MKSSRIKILITSPNWLGDTVMSFPLLGMLAAVDNLKLSVISPEYVARIFAGLQEVSELTVFSRAGRARRIWASLRMMRSLGAEANLVLPPSFSSAVPAFLARVPLRIGYRSDGRSMLLSAGVSREGLRDEHLSENYMRLGRVLLERLGIEKPEGFSPAVLRVFPSERDAVNKILSRRLPLGDGYAAIVPGAAYGPAKSWPWRSFKSLAAILAGHLPVVLAGSSMESALCGQIASGLDGVFDFSGMTTLGEFMALLEKARVVIANDSGASHIASSLGVPVVVIFGSTSPTWTAPLGEGVAIAREPPPCAPCFRRSCPEGLECLLAVGPQSVAGLAERVMRKESIIN